VDDIASSPVRDLGSLALIAKDVVTSVPSLIDRDADRFHEAHVVSAEKAPVTPDLAGGFPQVVSA